MSQLLGRGARCSDCDMRRWVGLGGNRNAPALFASSRSMSFYLNTVFKMSLSLPSIHLLRCRDISVQRGLSEVTHKVIIMGV